MYKPAFCIRHPLAPADKHGRKATRVEMVQHQISLAPVRIGTYQNQQGKTVRGPEDEPLGHNTSLRNPSYLSKDEYKQHLYMILGRAKALKWSLFHDFPMDKQGLPKWSWFEIEPPRYILVFFNALQPLAELTPHNVEFARQELRVFPLWRCRPALEHINSDSTDKMYVYNKDAWDKACSPSCPKRPQDGHLLVQACTSTGKRVRKKSHDTDSQTIALTRATTQGHARTAYPDAASTSGSVLACASSASNTSLSPPTNKPRRQRHRFPMCRLGHTRI